MQCHEIEELLSPFFDGEVHSSEGKAISNHLSTCPKCRAKWHAFRDAVDTIKNLPEIAPPAGFSAGVLKRLETAREAPEKTTAPILQRKLARGRWPQVLALAASVIFAVGITTLMFGTPNQWGTKNLFLAGEQVSQSESPGNSGKLTAFPGQQPDPVVGNPGEALSSNSGNGQNNPEPVLSEDGMPESFSALQQENGAGAASSQGVRGEVLPGEPLDDRQPGVSTSKQNAVVALNGSRNTAVQGLVSRQAAFGELPASRSNTPKIVRSASIDLDVDNPSGVPARLSDLASENGGYVLASDTGSGSVAMKVPAEHLTKVVSSIEGMGKATAQSGGEDVSKKYYDIEERLRELAAEEQKLLSSSGSPSGQQENMAELAKVRSNFNAQKEMLNKLETDVDFATVHISIK